MTENKRYSFNWERGHPNFWDNHCDLADCYLTCEDVVDRLNDLHEENQLLHKMNEDAIDFMYDNFDSNIMFTDRELNDVRKDMGWELSEKWIKIKQLEKENEELKQHNTELINKIDFLEQVIDGDVCD